MIPQNNLLDSGYYYEAELIPMGESNDGQGTTADETVWKDDKQTAWNIWIVLRDEEGAHVDEILDIDIPINLTSMAEALMGKISSAVGIANYTRVKLTDSP